MIRSLSAVSLLALGGCINLIAPASELPPRYTLTAMEETRSEQRLPYSLAIADARAESALNTSKIAVRTGANEIRYMPEGEWADRAPRIFSVLLERSVEERGALLAVSDRVALPLADFVLYSDIQRFEADRTTEPTQAIVIFRVRLESRNGMILGVQRFETRVPVDGDSTAEVAEALNRAASELSSDAAGWALERLSNARS
ncbi:hypothetical protein HK107_12480 [Parvularcula sp. ZS-1/3]|uniref:ABC-type transport auxiliary lipoprotein component domain-containing protein n=1 Tax=Parvularcula mediterranea TaxID=2732508 RepID=A0A7Y3W5Z5_9PROT|nr:ABC-type transport auxiliary lipoprotein family protein [Parvularcula mediterranea]NNU17139.1 hypothetical protein [Parvularcula mediterranea]